MSRIRRIHRRRGDPDPPGADLAARRRGAVLDVVEDRTRRGSWPSACTGGDGNPFVISEMLRDLVRQGVIDVDDGSMPACPGARRGGDPGPAGAGFADAAERPRPHPAARRSPWRWRCPVTISTSTCWCPDRAPSGRSSARSTSPSAPAWCESTASPTGSAELDRTRVADVLIEQTDRDVVLSFHRRIGRVRAAVPAADRRGGRVALPALERRGAGQGLPLPPGGSREAPQALLRAGVHGLPGAPSPPSPRPAPC